MCAIRRNYYMLAKCLWKMHTCSDVMVPASSRRPTAQQVIDPLVRAIEVLPGKKDNKREPILEPHYKLVSIIHKLIQRKELEASIFTLILSL